MSKPRTFSPEFKAKVALAALKGDKPLAALCREFPVSDSVIARWKQLLLERTSTLQSEGSTTVSTPGVGPVRSWNGARLRYGRMRNTLSTAVTATHSHAFVVPCLHPVSSTFASPPFVAW
jgi:transposase-like protein